MRLALLLCMLSFHSIAFAQPDPAGLAAGAIDAQNRAEAESREAGRARHQYSINKKLSNAQLQEHEANVAPLDEFALKKWDRQNGPVDPYWRYDIKQNGETMAVAKYSPKAGCVVDKTFQKNGFGLDNARRFITSSI